MTTEEKKKYIIETWRQSSGDRIAEMLKRYYSSLKENISEPVTNQQIENIFGGKLQI